MGKAADIFFQLIGIWADENEIYSKQGSIKSVDEAKRVCIVTPSDGGPDILDVSLEADYTEDAATDPKGFFLVPKVGSLVIVSFLNKTDGYISTWTEIDKVIAIQGEWIFNDGAFGGLTKLEELITKLNNAEGKINDLITFINTHVHTSAAPGSPTTPPVPVFTGGSLTPTQQSELENENVTHG